MKTLYAFLTILVLSLLSSCKDSGPISPSNQETDPFANGSSERNLVVVISDIHLGADLTYAETNKNLPYLEKFLETVRVSPKVKELVLAGDILDEWFVPANIDTYKGKDQHDFVQRIAITNKGVVDAFNRIIQEGKIKVTYVPGNHDLAITAANFASIFPGINQARDEVQGLGTYSPAGLPEVAIEHGHRYNFYCAPDPISNKDIAPGSILPAGY
ncbi:MAG: metallophosphoesterase, partial [Methanococcaceae archaeon]